MCAFLFFKQKTAYELRISDWSSDVCSSDLCRSPPVWLDQVPDARPPPLGVGDPDGQEYAADAGHRREDDERGGVAAGDHRQPRARERAEIGRASCRERVCQYV